MNYFRWGLFFLIAAVVLFCVWQSMGSDVPDEEIGGEGERPVSLTSPDLSRYESNSIRWRFKAARANVYERRDLTLFSDVEGVIYAEKGNGKPTFIKADRGRVEGNTQIVELWGKVSVVFGSGERLDTERLFLDQKKHSVFNRSPVTMTSPDERVNADSMSYDIDRGRLRLRRPRMGVDIREGAAQ